MTARDIIYILPIVLLAATSIVQISAIAVRRNHSAIQIITLVGLAAAFFPY
jgi:hypothetical protein